MGPKGYRNVASSPNDLSVSIFACLKPIVNAWPVQYVLCDMGWCSYTYRTIHSIPTNFGSQKAAYDNDNCCATIIVSPFYRKLSYCTCVEENTTMQCSSCLIKTCPTVYTATVWHQAGQRNTKQPKNEGLLLGECLILRYCLWPSHFSCFLPTEIHGYSMQPCMKNYHW